ncbi:MAG TPA: phosphotransferase family protein, partial [Novosphingobium sp.]|nr:phosphotransferase family protein [Novosphingobium sp.]
HKVDWQARGLADFGRPEGFNRRHLQRIARIPVDAGGAMLPGFVAGHDWLSAHVPAESGATIIHNDFRIGNLMWAGDAPPRIVAVLDWELATLGDPLMDLAYLIASLPRDGDSHTPVQDLARAALEPGFPPVTELVARYRALTGNHADTLRWHLALVNWKLAALYHYSRGKGTDPYFNEATHVPRFLAEAALHMG